MRKLLISVRFAMSKCDSIRAILSGLSIAEQGSMISSFTRFVFIVACYLGLISPAMASLPSCRHLLSPFLKELPPTAKIYLNDTLNSLEQMRGENGLVKDTIWLGQSVNGPPIISVLNPNTSPTNIAVDLLVQTEVGANPTILKILKTLEKLPFHLPTGLFFSRYSADKFSSVIDRDISAIDNLHLSIALWTIKRNHPQSEMGRISKRLFERMNFQVYYERKSGLVGGNLRYTDGTWFREAYNFDHFGSEARLLYSAGWALGLFHDERHNNQFLKRAVAALKIELHSSQQGELLRLWDGSAFQLYFPKIFAAEENYSLKMQSFYKAHLDFIVTEGERRHLPLPAAHSAGRTSIDVYRDKSGHRELVSKDNNDLHDPQMGEVWDQTIQPYALFMAATSNPSRIIEMLETIETAKLATPGLYVPTMGWVDGLHVGETKNSEVVPAQLSLNQAMIALSLLQMHSVDGMSPSGRAIQAVPSVRERMQRFYDLVEKKLNNQLAP